MNLNDYKLIFVAIGLIGVLIIASPVLAEVVRLPPGEQFSELYLLGPGHMAQDYPYNVEVGQSYSIFAGVGNHLGSSAYYVLAVKLKNQTDPFPNATNGIPSPLPILYEARFVIPDNQTLETPITFAVESATISENQSLIQTININNAAFSVDKFAAWNSTTTTYAYQLLFELWLYNPTTTSIEYNRRYVNLQLNLTATS
jgi:uncharacterized membrane protein